MSGLLGELQPADDGSAADWLFDALYAFDRPEVGSVIPPGFEAYGCLLHSELEVEGQIPHRLRIEDARLLAEALKPATSTPDRCWFGLWDGWGRLHVGDEVAGFAASAPLVGNRSRTYHLFSGRIEAVVGTITPWFSRDLPSLWWPHDRAWIVATEIDLSWTYLGAAEAVIDHALAAWPFDGRRVTPDDPIVSDGLDE